MKPLVGDRNRTLLAASLVIFLAVSVAMFLKLYPADFFPSDDFRYAEMIERAISDYSSNREEHNVLFSAFKAYNDRFVSGKNSYIMLSAMFRLVLDKMGVHMRMSDFMFTLNYGFLVLAVLMAALFLYIFSADAKLVAFYLLLNVFSPLNFTHITFYGYATIELFFLTTIIGLLCVSIYGIKERRDSHVFGAIVAAALLGAFSLFIVANMVVFIAAVVIAFALVLGIGAFIKDTPYSFAPGTDRAKKAAMVLSGTFLFVLLIAAVVFLNDQARYMIATGMGLARGKIPLWAEAWSLVKSNIGQSHLVRSGVEQCDYNGTYFLKYLTNVEPFLLLILAAGAICMIWRRALARDLIDNVYVSFLVFVSIISLAGIALFPGHPLLRSAYPAVGGLTAFAAFILARAMTSGVRNRRLVAGILLVLLGGHVFYSGLFMWRQYVARYSLVRYIESRGERQLFMLEGDRWELLLALNYSGLIEPVSAENLMLVPEGSLLVVGPRRYYGVIKMSPKSARQASEDVLPALGHVKPVLKLPFYSHDPAYLMQDEVAICESYYRSPSWLFKQNPAFSDDDYKTLIYRVDHLRGR